MKWWHLRIWEATLYVSNEIYATEVTLRRRTAERLALKMLAEEMLEWDPGADITNVKSHPGLWSAVEFPMHVRIARTRVRF